MRQKTGGFDASYPSGAEKGKQTKEDGFYKPSQSGGKGTREVSDPIINENLNIIRSSTATPQEKIEAMKAIESRIIGETPPLSSSDILEILDVFKNALADANFWEMEKYKIANNSACVFEFFENYRYALSDEHVPYLIDMAKITLENGRAEDYALSNISNLFDDFFVNVRKIVEKEDVRAVIESLFDFMERHPLEGARTLSYTFPVMLSIPAYSAEEIEGMLGKLVDFAKQEPAFSTFNYEIIAIQTLLFSTYRADSGYSLGTVLQFCLEMEKDANLPAAEREKVGSLFACCGFLHPEFFSTPDFAFFNLDPDTAKQMSAQSPDWVLSLLRKWRLLAHINYTDCGLNVPIDDFMNMYSLAKAHPEEPIIKTIFKDSNLTYFSGLSTEELEHLYFDRQQILEESLAFVFLTKDWGEIPFGRFIEPLEMDKRWLEPGKDHYEGLFHENMNRLGVVRKDINGRHIDCPGFAGHGTPFGIHVKDDPAGLDVTDKEMFRLIGEYCDPEAIGFVMGCGTAGLIEGYPKNLVETIAECTSTKMFGPQFNSGTSKTFYYAEKPDGGREIADMKYQWSPRNSYDYRHPEALELPSFAIQSTPEGTLVSWTASSTNGKATENFELERSVDGGITYDHVAFVDCISQGKADYSALDSDPRAAQYRIIRRDYVEVHGDGSRDYTVAISAPIKKDDYSAVLGQDTALLSQNYPNPVSASTTISFSLEKEAHAAIRLYDLAGREVAVLEDARHTPGSEKYIRFSPKEMGIPAGAYIYTLELDGVKVASRKMVVVE